MKKQKQIDKSSQRLLPPLDNLTLEDWARICEKVDAKYETKELGGFAIQEATR